MNQWTLLLPIYLVIGLVTCEDVVWVNDPVSGARYSVSRETYDKDRGFLMEYPNILDPSRQALIENECTSYQSYPTFFEFLNRTFISVEEFCFHPDRYPYSLSIYKRAFESIRWKTIVHSLISALLITIFRHILKIWYLSSSIGQVFTKPSTQMKTMTPLFNTIAYTILYIADSYVIFRRGYADFANPLCMFKDIYFKIGYFDDPIPSEYYWIYMLQLGFYIHSFYGTICLDVRRKDWRVLIVHHIITISLLHISLAVRFYRLGLVVVFLHDISDVFLEAGKWTVSFRNADPVRFAWVEYIANVLFVLFVVSWLSNRVYLFPIKVLYVTTWGIYLTHLGREAHFFLFFNIMLLALFVMHIYWSYYILKMVAKILMGNMPQIQDSREYMSDTESKTTQIAKVIQTDAFACNGHSNGFTNYVKQTRSD